MPEDRTAASWAAHAHARLSAWLRLSPRQRLDWLWQAKLFAERARLAAIERGTAKAPRRP
jgi:hypothetical protein